MKEQGFTLIELLAVIVVLAIIALIATPIILNVIDKAKSESSANSALGYVDSVEKQVVINQVNSVNIFDLTEEREYSLAELSELGVKIKGTIDSATVTINSKGIVTSGKFCINNYAIDYDGETAIVSKTAKYCEVNDPNYCGYEIGQEWIFDYTGDEQVFAIPCNGNYKLETWGAQGGSSKKSATYVGGYGAYSVGDISLEKNNTLYINVGGVGNLMDGPELEAEGGYNGGGSGATCNTTTCAAATDTSSGTGGGATHIALLSGLLSTLSEHKDEVIIVSGAGGGGCWHNSANSGRGGNAGGISGSGSTDYGSHIVVYNRYGLGGLQDKKVCNAYTGDCSDFGLGGYGLGGGGAGWYGGSGGSFTSGGGGSSYIGNPLLTNKVMYCYNCTESSVESTKTISTTNVSETPISNYAKLGNGYAKITYLGNE